MYLIFLNCDNIIFIKCLSDAEKLLKDTHWKNTPSDKLKPSQKVQILIFVLSGHQINYL